MIVRRELPGDIDTIRRVTAEAFTRPAGAPGGAVSDAEPVEVALVDRLRADEGWLPALSLVAVDGEAVVGHVVCTRGRVVCTRGRVGETAALGLGPLSVAPGHQRRGVGSALMHAVLGAADARDEAMVVLLGDPAYYSRFGFRPAGELGIEPPVAEWAPYFQVRTLTAYDPSSRGVFAYARPFDDL